MIQLKQLSLQLGTKVLFDNANLIVHAQQKVGVVGANGSGKTSFFRLLLGELRPDHGEVSVPAHLEWAYIQQELPDLEISALDYVLQGDAALIRAQAQLQAAEASHDGLAMAEAHGLLQTLDAYTAPFRAAKILLGLGFGQEELQKPIAAFSGGWRVRLNLAQVLQSRADILLLDEPTNHLDFDAIVWLEEWLSHCKATVLVISHDREFLDHVTTHTLHLCDQTLKLYTGNYSAFEKQYAQQLEQQQASFEKQEKAKKHLQSFVDRFRAKASKAKQAQSRMKMIERLGSVAAVHLKTPFHFHFKPAPAAGDPLLSIKHVSFSYGDHLIFDNIQCALRPKDRIGLIGPNGAGKSTLIKLIVGDLVPQQGEVTKNPKLKIGYFAQHQLEQLHLAESPFWHLKKTDPMITEVQARTFLGGFNFQGMRAFEPIVNFSGGEKTRLALALIIWQAPNLLLLDEPTNHLDMEMREALAEALLDFDGAVLVVSHDRYLLKTTVDEFWRIAEHQVKPFVGDLDDYQQWVLTDLQQKAAKSEKTQKTGRQDDAGVSPMAVTKPAPNLVRLRSQLQTVEKKLTQKQAALKKTTEALQDPDLYTENRKHPLNTLLMEQKQLQSVVQELEAQMLAILEQLESPR